MKNKYYLLWPATFLAVVACNGPNKDLEKTCTPIVGQILEVQNNRDIIREDFRITLMDYGEGKVSLKRLKEEKRQWLTRENKLATKVDALYDKAYNMGCL